MGPVYAGNWFLNRLDAGWFMSYPLITNKEKA